MDSYVSDLKVRRPGKYAEETKAQIEHAMESCSWTVSVPAMVAFRAKCKQPRDGRVMSNRRVNMYVGAVSRMFRWARRLGLIDKNPIEYMPKLPEREVDRVKRRRPMTDKEREALLAAVRSLDADRQVPQEPLWRTILETGLRWREAVTLQVEDVRESSIVVGCRVAKSGSRRVIPITRSLAALLRKTLPFRSPRGFPWRDGSSNGWRMLMRELRRAGIVIKDRDGRSIDVHALRHDCATYMHRKGVSLDAIASVMGHADPEMTRRVYIHADVEALRKEVRKAWR